MSTRTLITLGLHTFTMTRDDRPITEATPSPNQVDPTLEAALDIHQQDPTDANWQVCCDILDELEKEATP